jgi:hypothetical protein
MGITHWKGHLRMGLGFRLKANTNLDFHSPKKFPLMPHPIYTLDKSLLTLLNV